MKYRKKPVIIEAIQFEDNSDRIIEIHEFMGSSILASQIYLRKLMKE